MSPPQTLSDPHLRAGAKVEISSLDEGFVGSFFPGAVIRRADNNKFLVEHDDLTFDAAGTIPLRETLPAALLRPIPPPPEEEEAGRGFEPGDEVDARRGGAWWEGVVAEELGDGRFKVFFRAAREEGEFGGGELRLHREWVAGKWVVGKRVTVTTPLEGEEVKKETRPTRPPEVLSATRSCRRRVAEADMAIHEPSVPSPLLSDQQNPSPRSYPRRSMPDLGGGALENSDPDRVKAPIGVCGRSFRAQRLSRSSRNSSNDQGSRAEAEIEGRSVGPVEGSQGRALSPPRRQGLRRCSQQALQNEGSVAAKAKSTKATREKFPAGALVEVSSDEDGFQGAWFDATVVKALKKNKFLIEYKSLRNDDDTEFLREEVDSLHIRPHPPETPVVDQFKLLDEVDASYNDGWWIGAISKVLPDSRYIVYFKNTKEEIEFEHSELRLHQEWICGKWVVTSKALKL